MDELSRKEMVKLGQSIRTTKIKQYRKFLALSKKCDCRAITEFRSGFSFMCTHPKLEDPKFNWGCSPHTCPHVGKLDYSKWEDIEETPSKEEIKDYVS